MTGCTTTTYYTRFLLPLFFLAFHLWVLVPIVDGSSQPVDRDALLAVRKVWGSPQQLESWDPAAFPNHCNWTGVTCGTGGGAAGVIGLALSHLNLTAGSVPASVCALKNLTRLDLSYNNLAGAFPADTLYACEVLTYLDLSNNNFSGPLPRDIDRLSPAMEHLNLSTNSFDGEVPAAVARLPALRSLILYKNSFTGEVPAQLQSAVHNMSFLGNPGLCARAGSDPNLPTCPGGGRGVRGEPSKGLIIIILAAIAGIALVCGIGAALAWLLFWRRNKTYAYADVMPEPDRKMDFTESDVLRSIRDKKNLIGSGASGKVYRVDFGAGRTVAVKKMCSTNEKQFKKFEEEARLHRKLQHQNIVKLLHCIHTQEDLCLVLEYMENGSLSRWLPPREREGAPSEPLDWPTRLSIAINAAKGLSYMHHDILQPVMHRDVKSDNILLDHNLEAKIADFGLSRDLFQGGQPNCVSGVEGTPGCMAPEILQNRNVNEKVDVYGFGVVLLQLITGKAPDYKDTGLVGWVRRCVQKGTPFVDEAIIRKLDRNINMTSILSVLDIGLKCTRKDPGERPSMRKVLEQLTRIQRQQISARSGEGARGGL